VNSFITDRVTRPAIRQICRDAGVTLIETVEEADR
jgi:hypothetical protein